MSLITRLRIARTRRSRTHHASVEAATRAKRARDHLERKRARERQRRERERRRAEASRSRARLRGALSPLVFAGGLALGALLAAPASELLLMRPATLEQVAVQGARTLTARAIAMRAGLEPGRSLAAVDPEAVREAVGAEPWIESVRTLRLPSGTLVISVVEREAVARWQLDESSPIELVDERGERFGGQIVPERALPLVRGRGDEGSALSSEALDLLAELGRHAPLARDPAAITLQLPDPAADARAASDAGGRDAERAPDESGYVLQVGESGPRALLGRTLLKQRIARLATLLDSGEAEISTARWIDLRYADRAVLRTEPVSG
jgi:cell division septal protein FtsQ